MWRYVWSTCICCYQCENKILKHACPVDYKAINKLANIFNLNLSDMIVIQNCNNINFLAFIRFNFILWNSEMYLSIRQMENMDHLQCYSWGGAMVHRPIQQKNGPLTTEIAILNLERRAHWNFKFISNKWKMVHTIFCPAITLV